MADKSMSYGERGIVAGGKVVGGLLSLFIAKAAADSITSGLTDVATIGLDASGNGSVPDAPKNGLNEQPLPTAGQVFRSTGGNL